MTDVINLRQHRKRKARSDKERQAEANRLLHGQTKAEKLKKRTEDDRAKKHIDGHKRQPESPSENPEDV